jgi:hypothetical protein
LADETYTVRITHDGSGSHYLYFDAVAVLGASTTLSAGTYDDADTALLFSPSANWVSASGNSAFLNSTYTYTLRAGDTLQFAVNGNAFTLYASSYASGSKNVEICVVNGDGTNNGENCTNISLNSATSVMSSPITIYGLGSGGDVYINNRDHGRYLIIDAIVVHN